VGKKDNREEWVQVKYKHARNKGNEGNGERENNMEEEKERK
jgi:hypothetical protein